MMGPPPDGPADEEEPGELIRREFDALTHHPRTEAARVRELATEGETGATAFIVAARLAARLLPLVVVMVTTVLTVYYVTR